MPSLWNRSSLKGENLVLILSFSVVTLLLIGCGTKVGNPKQPASGKEGVEKPTEQIALPTLNFEIDPLMLSNEDVFSRSSNVNLNLNPGNLDEARFFLQRYGTRMHNLKKMTNLAISVFDEMGINKLGSFSELGPNKKIFALVEKTEGGPYEYRANICRNEEPFIQIKWTKNAEAVEVIRSFKYHPYTEDPKFTKDLIVKIVRKKEGSRNTLAASMHGRYWMFPSPELDYLYETIKVSRYNDGMYTFTAATDWRPGQVASVSELKDFGVLKVHFAPIAPKFFVGYNKKKNDTCAGSFDLNKENFCIFGTAQVNPPMSIKPEQRPQALEAISGVETLSVKNFNHPVFDKDAKCKK